MKTFNSWLTKTGIASSVTVAALWSVSSFVAYAAQANLASGGVTNTTELGALMCNIIAVMFWILIIVAVIMIIMAGFNYVLAGDDTEKTTKARKMLTYAAIGIAVALLAEGVPQIVSSIFPAFSGNVALGTVCAPF